MKLLLIILSLMTFTIQDKHSVATSEDKPLGMQVSYANTGSKGSVTAGQEATLRLTGLGGITIDQITVYVKSNKSSGAGEFTVQANGQSIAFMDGYYTQWIGHYDNTTFHPVTLLQHPEQGVADLTVSLKGTQNSLHIERYDIQWTPTEVRTVTLMYGNRLLAAMKEKQGNAGIILPNVPDSAEWKFRGWTETEFLSTTQTPPLYPANTQYVPASDCTLWAVFEYRTEERDTDYATQLTDGEYRYVNSANNIVLSDVPMEGVMASGNLDLSNDNQVYSISFPDSATAYISHAATGTPIGYSGTLLVADVSPWHVYHSGEETLFYTESGGKKYILWPNIMDGRGENVHAGLLQANIGTSPMRLLPVADETDDRYFTCHPEVPMGLEETTEGTSGSRNERVIMYLGNYQLKIKNGKKIIEL